MSDIIYLVGGTVYTIFRLSFVVGILLLFAYIIVNGYAQSRSFYKAPRKVRKVVSFLIDFTRTWGPNCLIFFFMGSLLIRLLQFIF